MSECTVVLAHVARSFGSTQVFRDVSIELFAGSVFGLVGLNGAGKTTLIRTMLGLLKADTGTCRVLGEDPWKHRGELYRRLGVVLEHNGFWGNLSVAENLDFFARASNVSPAETKEYLDTYWRDTAVHDRRQKVKYFSRGEKMQCALCRAFLGWPSVFFLDEPVVALDVRAYDHFGELVKQARERGSTVLISSHQLDAVEELCDRVGVLENGTLSILDTSRGGKQPWLIRTANETGYGQAIAQHGGDGVRYADGAWLFSLDAGQQKAVADIVTRLVGLGAQIGEVRCRGGGLRESIRRHYGQSGPRTNSLSPSPGEGDRG